MWPGRVFGWVGVDIFFVLSGFLVGRLVIGEVQKKGCFDAKRFLMRRAFKLWPILYVFLILMCLMVPWPKFLFQIGLHVQNYLITPVATHLWSLAVEEHFYLAFALVCLYFAKKNNMMKISFFIVALVPLCLLLRFFAALSNVDAHVIQIQTQFRIDAIAIGVFLAGLYMYQPQLFDRINASKKVLAIIFFVGAIWLASVDKYSFWGSTLGYTVSLLWGVSILMLIYRVKFSPKVMGGCRALAFMGVYSYAIYIWHVPVIRIVEMVLGRADFTFSRVYVVASAYVLSIVAGVIVTKIIERPFLKIRDKVFPSKVGLT